MHVTSEADTDYTFAFSALPTGQRTHISYFGTSHVLTPDHFDFADTPHRVFHLGLPGIHNIMDAPWKDDANGWVATLKKAQAAGLLTNMELASLAPERLAALVRPCLPHLDLLVVNDHEIGGIAGFETVCDGKTDPAACEDAAKTVLAMGVAQMVVAHFPMGAVVVSRDGLAYAPALGQRAALRSRRGERSRRCVRRRFRLRLSRRLERRGFADAGACRCGGVAPRDIDHRIRRRVVGVPGACRRNGVGATIFARFQTRLAATVTDAPATKRSSERAQSRSKARQHPAAANTRLTISSSPTPKTATSASAAPRASAMRRGTSRRAQRISRRSAR